MSRRNDSVYLLLAILFSLFVDRSAPGEQPTDADDLRDRIEAIGQNNDRETVRQLIADVEATGKANKDDAYYRNVLALCERLNSWVRNGSQKVGNGLAAGHGRHQCRGPKTAGLRSDAADDLSIRLGR